MLPYHPGYYRWPAVPLPPTIPYHPRFPPQRWVPVQAPPHYGGARPPPPTDPTASSNPQASSTNDSSKAGFIPMKSSLENRFYGPLALLLALEPEGGHQVKSILDPIQTFQSSILRNFLDAVCYLCDRDMSDGDTTTAAALEQKDEKVVIWLAASGGVKEITCELLARILDLSWFQIKKGEPAVSKKLLAMAVIHSMPRLKKYEKLAEGELRACTKEIAKSDAMRKQERYIEVIRWFHSFMEQTALKEGGLDKMLNLIPFCHQARHTDCTIRQFLTAHFNSEGTDCFSRLWYYLGKFAKYIEALEVIHTCLVEYPRIAKVIHVESIPGSPKTKFPLLSLETFPRELLETMYPDGESDEQLECKENLRRMARSLGSKHLISRMKSRCGETRVHAELLILDHFRHNNLYFFEDLYIACSEPSCYLCYRYYQTVEALGYSVVFPDTSDRLCPDWGCPDVPIERGSDGDRKRKRDMKIMIKFIGRDLMQQLRCRESGSWYPDSSIGVSSLPRRRIMAKPVSEVAYHDDIIKEHAADLVDEEHEEEVAAAAAAGQDVVVSADIEEQLVDKEEPAKGQDIMEAAGEEIVDDAPAAEAIGEAQALAEEVAQSVDPLEKEEIVDTEDDEEGSGEEYSEEEGSYDEDDDDDEGDGKGEAEAEGEDARTRGDESPEIDIIEVIVEHDPEELPPPPPPPPPHPPGVTVEETRDETAA